MPYAAIEDIYETLSSEKQREVYDFIRFLAAQAGRKVSPSTPIESYSDDFRLSLDLSAIRLSSNQPTQCAMTKRGNSHRQ